MKAPFNRHVVLIVLNVKMSNPNGDPDMESEPRTRELDGLGMISPVSFKRKNRDLVSEKSCVFEEAEKELKLGKETGNLFKILEEKGRDRDYIKKLSQEQFKQNYWDARLFGNTFLEELDENDKKSGKCDHFINTGTVQVGVGLSVAPIDTVRMSYTGKAEQKDGKKIMAPLAFRVVQHGIYTIPIYVNPGIAYNRDGKGGTGATSEDLELFKFILPYVYDHTKSAIRPEISVLHAWFAEHKNTLGSCPEHLFINALTPNVKQGITKPKSMDDYDIPNKDDLGELVSRFKKVEDLMDNI